MADGQQHQSNKEPLKESGRFQVFINTVIFEVLLLGAGVASDQFGWQIPTELLQHVALTIGGLAMTLIAGRSYRNTPTK